MAKRILVVEDNKDIQKLLRLNLLQEGFEVVCAFDGKEGLAKAGESNPDLIILDINLPKLSGVELCKQLKSKDSFRRIPIIMLTVRKDEIDRVLAFELGVDDYVTKPFSPRELILRIKVALRRAQEPPAKAKVIACADLSLDEDSFEVKLGARPIALTSTEFKLLRYFILRKERLLSRQVLLENVWGYNSGIDTRTVDAHIKSLRRKIPFRRLKISTVVGMGYKLTANA